MRWFGKSLSATAGRAVLVLPLVLLSGCGLFGGSGKKPAPQAEPVAMLPAGAQIQVALIATPVVNPDPNGRPSPIAFSLYELTSPGPFKGADATALFDHASATLGPTMLASYTDILYPGDAKVISTKLNSKALYFAVVGNYRAYQTAKWRALVPLAGRKTKIQIVFTGTGVKISPE